MLEDLWEDSPDTAEDAAAQRAIRRALGDTCHRCGADGGFRVSEHIQLFSGNLRLVNVARICRDCGQESEMRLCRTRNGVVKWFFEPRGNQTLIRLLLLPPLR